MPSNSQQLDIDPRVLVRRVTVKFQVRALVARRRSVIRTLYPKCSVCGSERDVCMVKRDPERSRLRVLGLTYALDRVLRELAERDPLCRDCLNARMRGNNSKPRDVVESIYKSFGCVPGWRL